MANKLTLVIMAAGMGSRYGGLKQMDGFGPSGETLLEYSLYDAMRAGFDRAVFIIREDIEADFRAGVLSRFEQHIDGACAFQQLDSLPEGYQPPYGRVKPWGTAHAVLCAREHVHTPFAVINADDAYGRDAFEQLAGFLKTVDASRPDYALCGFALERTLSDHGSVSRGICEVDPAGKLISVTEHTRLLRSAEGNIVSETETGTQTLPGDVRVSMNLWGFTPVVFDALNRRFTEFLDARGTEAKSECYLPSVIDAEIQSGQATVRVIPTSSDWIGVTYPEDRPVAAAAMAQRVASSDYPQQLWA